MLEIAYQDYKSPLSIQLEITSACNHKCLHCYNHWREPGSSIGTLSSSQIKKIIQNLVSSEVQELTITGGEPLLFPHLMFEAIDFAQQAGIRCHLNTNLSLMTNDLAQELYDRGISILTSFLSYDPVMFDRIACNPGAFKRVIQGINTALEHDIHITANMVVMQENLDHVYQTGLYVQSLGISSFTATRVHPSQTCRQFNRMQLDPTQIKSVFDTLLKLRDEHHLSIDTLTCYPMCLFVDIDRYGDLLLHRSCSAGKTAGTIGADGGVRPCGHADEVYGNALEESLLDIWPRMADWRNGSYIPNKCKSCEWVGLCGAGCRMDSKYFHGTKDQQDPYMETENIKKITLCNKDVTLDADPDQLLQINPTIRYRHEDFGVVVTVGNTVRTITKDSANLLVDLSEKAFTLNEITEAYDVDLGELKTFFSGLLQSKIALTVEEHN